MPFLMCEMMMKKQRLLRCCWCDKNREEKDMLLYQPLPMGMADNQSIYFKIKSKM